MERGDDPLRIYSDGVGRPAVAAVSRRLSARAESAADGGGELLRHRQPQRAGVDQPARSRTARGAHRSSAAASSVAPLLGGLQHRLRHQPQESAGAMPGCKPLLKPRSPSKRIVYRVDGVAPRAFVPAGARAGRPRRRCDRVSAHSSAPAARVAVARAALPPADCPRAMAGSVRSPPTVAEEVELDGLDADRRPGRPHRHLLPGLAGRRWTAPRRRSCAPTTFARGVFVPAGEHQHRLSLPPAQPSHRSARSRSSPVRSRGDRYRRIASAR